MTQTNEVGDLINSINNIEILGKSDVLKAIKVAQLSLKHRMNKNQRQRIVVFVGHPLDGTEEDFEDVGARLKKNAVSVDVINFAHPDNVSRLTTLVQTANAGSEDAPNCHFLDVPAGVTHITDVMITSPIVQPDDMGGAAAGGGGAAGADDPMRAMGIDPSLDPELAEAIRLSMMDQNQAANNDAGANQEANAPADTGPGVQPGLNAGAADDDDMYEDVEDDDQALKEALELSRMPQVPEKKAEEEKPKEPEVKPPTVDVNIDDDFMNDVMNDLGIDVDGEDEKKDEKKDGADKDKK